MANIRPHKNKSGEVVSYYIQICLGRDEQYKPIFKTKTIKRPKGLTPAREHKEVERIADAWELEQRKEYQTNHSVIDKEKIPFAVFVKEHWIPDHVMDGSHTPKGVRFFEDTSNKLIAYFGPRKKLAAITTEDCKRYIGWMRTEAKQKSGKPYSQATIKHQYDTLRNILKYAERMDYIDRDPTIKLSEKEKPKVDNPVIEFLPPEQAKRFMDCLKQENIFWQTLVTILITSGLRRGEAVGLQWQDIDMDEYTITVQRSVSIDKNSENKIHIGKTKTGKNRTVPTTKNVCEMLQSLKTEYEKIGYAVLPTAFIFHSKDDPYKPIYPTHVTMWLRRFVTRNDLPKVSPHDLRHTAATLALESGANLKEVQELMGHSNPATTMKYYSGVTDEAKRRTVDGIERLLTSQPAT